MSERLSEIEYAKILKAYFQNLCNELNKRGIDISISDIIV
jgi:hypothetical protein